VIKAIQVQLELSVQKVTKVIRVPPVPQVLLVQKATKVIPVRLVHKV
jgi:hypothetical protein